MITRFYVDNYKCLVNFEYKPKPMELIIGANGSGKTTVFEALDKLRRFVVGGESIQAIFSDRNTTRWQHDSQQVFELTIDEPMFGKIIIYRLVIGNTIISQNSISHGLVVKEEKLYLSGELVIDSTWVTKKADADEKRDRNRPRNYREITLNSQIDTKDPFPMANPNYSAMSLGMGFWIKDELEKILFLRLDASDMKTDFEREEKFPSSSFDNFGSYYSHVLQEKQEQAFYLTQSLRAVISGFNSFSLPKNGADGRKLILKMNQPAKDLSFDFSEISDGQRALIAFYTLIHCTLDSGITLIIDEPENYIGLRELQPLIVLMEEQVREKGGQILLISHNQEFINMLTDRGQCVRFYRENNGHTRIAEFNPDSELTAAEIVARGWEDDE